MEKIMDDLLVLWKYLCLNNNKSENENKSEEECKCIIGLGSILKLVPEKCAKLYKEGLGKYIIFSGNCGKGTEGIIKTTEAERFKEIAIEEGVPEQAILIEPTATTTYENFKYIKRVLIKNNLNPESFLIVGKPYQERRALAIADIELADKKYEIASHNITFNDYLEYVKKDKDMNIEDVVNEMIGEIRLIRLAPKFGWQSFETIPVKVLQSYHNIIRAGYIKDVYDEGRLEKYNERLRDIQKYNDAFEAFTRACDEKREKGELNKLLDKYGMEFEEKGKEQPDEEEPSL